MADEPQPADAPPAEEAPAEAPAPEEPAEAPAKRSPDKPVSTSNSPVKWSEN